MQIRGDLMRRYRNCILELFPGIPECYPTRRVISRAKTRRPRYKVVAAHSYLRLLIRLIGVGMWWTSIVS